MFSWGSKEDTGKEKIKTNIPDIEKQVSAN